MIKVDRTILRTRDPLVSLTYKFPALSPCNPVGETRITEVAAPLAPITDPPPAMVLMIELVEMARIFPEVISDT